MRFCNLRLTCKKVPWIEKGISSQVCVYWIAVFTCNPTHYILESIGAHLQSASSILVILKWIELLQTQNMVPSFSWFRVMLAHKLWMAVASNIAVFSLVKSLVLQINMQLSVHSYCVKITVTQNCCIPVVSDINVNSWYLWKLQNVKINPMLL